MKILFYAKPSGRSPVEEFISGLPERLRAAILLALDEIREMGLEAPGVSFRKIEGKLWELRIQAGSAARLFYVVLTEPQRDRRMSSPPVTPEGSQEQALVMLHGYLKKTQKAPIHELDVARNRLKELER